MPYFSCLSFPTYLLQIPCLLTPLSAACKSEPSFLVVPWCCCCGHTPLPVPLGSSCQMRTLDSGIGTFPLPDSVTRSSSRCIPKSESSPDRVTAGASDPDPSQPDVKVPSLPKMHRHAPEGSMAHSASEPAVTSSRIAKETQSRLPKLSSSDAIRTKRLSFCGKHSNISASTEDEERKMKAKEQDSTERVLKECPYMGSCSNTETEPERTGTTLVSPQRTRRPDSVEQNEDTLKSQNVEKSLSIMDYYQHEMFSHLEKDGRRISQYNLLHKESSLDGKAGDLIS
ncbi:hypothetical protein GOODEAATRI_013759, partial [Goodea atripinnis]